MRSSRDKIMHGGRKQGIGDSTIVVSDSSVLQSFCIHTHTHIYIYTLKNET